jgi:hypothetical protein
MAEHFFDEERVALGLRVHEVDELLRRRAAGTAGEHRRDAILTCHCDRACGGR